MKKPLEENPLTVAECQTMIKGAIDAIIDNREYFYNSHVGPQYSHLTTEGKTMLVKSMNTLLPLLAQAKERELDERAKAITWNSLQEQHDQ
jgi:hypothetical protein